jgi:hypothetical protein
MEEKEIINPDTTENVENNTENAPEVVFVLIFEL